MKKPPYTSVMGFDFGTRNIGIAMGQAVTRTANAITPIKARDGIPDWETLARIVDEWNPDAFVVGIPLNMDGTESEMSRRARKFGNRLMARFDRAWHPVDERLTSFEAKEWAKKLGHKGHYGSDPVDAMAAQLLLESWMNDQGAELLSDDI